MSKNYSIDFFLKDSEFIRWVHNPDKESSAYWTTFARQNPGSKDEMLKAIEIIRALQIKKERPDEAYKQKVLNNIITSISDDAKANHPNLNLTKRIYRQIIKSAAVFILLIGSAYLIYNYIDSVDTGTTSAEFVQNEFFKETSSGTKIQTRLPDGSTVWLNAETQIKYYKDTLSQTRNVHLIGEAFFDVVSDPSKPFIVSTGNISVKAIGTSFNVNSYNSNGIFEVALLSGKVLVANHQEEQSFIELSPGEKAIVSKNRIKKSKIEYSHDVGWREGILSFKSADFHQVKSKLERWYGVKIQVDNDSDFNNWEIDGEFEKLSLEMTLQHLSYTKDFRFRIEENEVFISKN